MTLDELQLDWLAEGYNREKVILVFVLDVKH